MPPLSEITYAAVQRHRAHVYQTMRDASKLQPVDFVSMFDAGAFAKDKKKANTRTGKEQRLGIFRVTDRTQLTESTPESSHPHKG